MIAGVQGAAKDSWREERHQGQEDESGEVHGQVRDAGRQSKDLLLWKDSALEVASQDGRMEYCPQVVG